MHVIDKAEIHDRQKLHSPELRKVWAGVRQVLPKARRFLFDREASAFAGRFIREHGATLLRNRAFAIPPFEQTYVEYHLDALLEAIGRRKANEKYGIEKSDERIGHLIDGDHVWTFLEGSDNEASIYPVDVWMNTVSHSVGLFDKADIGRDRRRKLEYTLGSTLGDAQDVNGEVVLDWLNAFDFAAPAMFANLLTDRKLADAGNGTVRNLVALLLLLNRQRENVTLKTVAPKGVIYRGKRRVFAAHTMVTLTVEDYVHIAHSYEHGAHASPRRHQVRGFFRHLHKVDGCEHDYPLASDERGRWVCRTCGTTRVWVHDHERGDASKGYITKDYVVVD
jgi:hypothetical protein